MNPTKSTRRDLVKGAGLAAMAWTIVKPGSVYGAPANSRLKVGLLGTGRRGSRVSQYFVENPNSEVTALADLYDDHIARAQETIPAKDAKIYKSAKAILDADIDAVYIATPPYLHPEHFEMAVETGKHIFMEKPMAVDPAGVRRVLAAAKKVKPGQMVIVDFQQRWGKDYRSAYELVAGGEIGEITMVRSAWLGGGLPLRTGHPADQEKVRNWLYYKERSGDIIVEQNCHNLDVVNWFTHTHPVSCMGYGARALRKEPGDIRDTLAVTYKLPDGRVWSHSGNQISMGGYRDVGEYFFGSKGTVHTSRQGYELYVEGREMTAVKTAYDITKDTVNYFVAGTRGEVPTENAAVFAAESTLTAIMGRIAMDLEREVTWDEVFNM